MSIQLNGFKYFYLILIIQYYLHTIEWFQVLQFKFNNLSNIPKMNNLHTAV